MYQLTARKRAFLQNLTVDQVAKKTAAFYDTQRFNTVLTKARRRTVSCVTWFQSAIANLTSLRPF
jgi:hypothetical protein